MGNTYTPVYNPYFRNGELDNIKLIYVSILSFNFQFFNHFFSNLQQDGHKPILEALTTWLWLQSVYIFFINPVITSMC